MNRVLLTIIIGIFCFQLTSAQIIYRKVAEFEEYGNTYPFSEQMGGVYGDYSGLQFGTNVFINRNGTQILSSTNETSNDDGYEFILGRARLINWNNGFEFARSPIRENFQSIIISFVMLK